MNIFESLQKELGKQCWGRHELFEAIKIICLKLDMLEEKIIETKNLKYKGHDE